MRVPYYGNTQNNQSFGVGSTIHYYDEKSWGAEKEHLPTVAEYSTPEEYAPWQLDRFADRILWEDIQAGRANDQEPVVLMFEHLKERRKREIYVASGTPDETITNELSSDGQMMYWRTHPKGRKVQNQTAGNKASFYR